MPAPADLKPFVAYFEQLKREDLPQLGRFYAADIRFKDPFNEVVGVEAVAGIFHHMFEVLDNPRFVVTTRIVQGDQCFVVWDFLFRFKTMQRGVDQCVRGGSHLVFKPGADGVWRIDMHRDYWDAAEEMYEKFPLVGSLMRWLKNRVNS
jgi:ketosteroid isomerase-like protein